MINFFIYMILISGCFAHKIVTFILVQKKKKKDCDIHAAVERLISVSLFQEKGKQTILQLGRVVKSKYVMDYR